jgi:hypothetical protein
MIDELDDALRDLLVRDLPITNNEVDIAFDQPTRDWASRLSRPTLNLFMHDMRENNRLRTQQPFLGNVISGMSATVSPNPVRLDVHYMVTAWANDPGDEHRLLGRTLMVLYRYLALPDEFRYGSLENLDFEVLIKVAQYDQRDIRREIWSMLDNEMRPIIDLTVTLAVEPFGEWTVPLVRQSEISFASFDGTSGNGAGMNTLDQFYRVSGMVHGVESVPHFSIQMLDYAIPVTIATNGRYSIQNLRPGSYRLEVWTGEGEPVVHTIEVPSPPAEYDIYL